MQFEVLIETYFYQEFQVQGRQILFQFLLFEFRVSIKMVALSTYPLVVL